MSSPATPGFDVSDVRRKADGSTDESSVIPRGWVPSPHAPDEVIVRCLCCGVLGRFEDRANAHAQADKHAIECGSQVTRTPIAQVSTEIPERGDTGIVQYESKQSGRVQTARGPVIHFKHIDEEAVEVWIRQSTSTYDRVVAARYDPNGDRILPARSISKDTDRHSTQLGATIDVEYEPVPSDRGETFTDETVLSWRFRCPEGHHRLSNLRDGGYYCKGCRDSYDGDPIDQTEEDHRNADRPGERRTCYLVDSTTDTVVEGPFYGEAATEAAQRSDSAHIIASKHRLRRLEDVGYDITWAVDEEPERTIVTDGGSRRIVYCRRQSQRRKYHLPDPDNPDEPACATTLRADGDWTTGTEDELQDRWDLCRRCDPDVEITQPETGTQLRRELERLDPEDVIVTDGGVPTDQYLGDHRHYCDICEQVFRRLDRLAGHDCSMTDGSGDLYGCDTPRCDGRKEVVTPDGYVCHDCADALAEKYEEEDPRLMTDGGQDVVTWYQAVCPSCEYRLQPRRRKWSARIDARTHGCSHVELLSFEKATFAGGHIPAETPSAPWEDGGGADD